MANKQHVKYDAARSMKSGLTEITFKKKNGRTVTRIATLVGADMHDKKAATQTRNVLKFLDVGAKAWRSCDTRNVVSFGRVYMK